MIKNLRSNERTGNGVDKKMIEFFRSGKYQSGEGTNGNATVSTENENENKAIQAYIDPALLSFMRTD